jgi:hypothetical protein
MKNKNKILIIIASILFLIIVIFLYKNNNTNYANKNIIKNLSTLEVIKKDVFLANNPISKKATLEINNEKYETEIIENTSVYDFMKKLKKEKKIDFIEKKYIGMGIFIDEINGIKTNGEKYWIYYVNNIKADIGISNYKIKPGDIISWRYEAIY